MDAVAPKAAVPFDRRPSGASGHGAVGFRKSARSFKEITIEPENVDVVRQSEKSTHCRFRRCEAQSCGKDGAPEGALRKAEGAAFPIGVVRRRRVGAESRRRDMSTKRLGGSIGAASAAARSSAALILKTASPSTMSASASSRSATYG